MFLPTAALAPLCQAAAGRRLSELRDVIVAGEQLKITNSTREFFDRNDHVRLHNHYGPCETHVVTSHTMSGPATTSPQLPPIGQPLPHVVTTIQTSAATLAAPDEIGELILRGPSVALGYYRDDQRTAERFSVDEGGTKELPNWRPGSREPSRVSLLWTV